MRIQRHLVLNEGGDWKPAATFVDIISEFSCVMRNVVN